MFQLQPLLGAFFLNRVSGLNSANFPEQDAVFPHPEKPSAPLHQLLLRGFELASRAGKLSSSSRAPALFGHLVSRRQGNAGLAESGAVMVAAGGGFQATVAPWDTRAKNTGDTAFSARRLGGDRDTHGRSRHRTVRRGQCGEGSRISPPAL